MRVSYHADYYVELPPTHSFPMRKYRDVCQSLLASGTIGPADLMEPIEAPLEMLARIHTAQYLNRLVSGSLSDLEQRRIGVPWSPRLWRRSRLAVQGTLLAAVAALEDGLAGNLAGGTHHAFADHGEGFCVLNDVAIAIRELQARQSIARALVIDLDVHQGNGTAAIFAGDPSVYTFSMHGARNYPAHKPPSSRDVALPDGTGDDDYLTLLRAHLPEVCERARADLVFYLAGVDVVAGDRLGRLSLSTAGIAERDRLVIDAMYRYGLPAAILLAGGYAPTVEQTSELHAQTFQVARQRERQ